MNKVKLDAQRRRVKIRKYIARGLTVSEIAAMLDVSRQRASVLVARVKAEQ